MTDYKLTLQDCFKYPEAEIRHNSGGSFKSVFELIIKSYDANMSTLYMLADYDCKLILRDITELTNEEKEYITSEYFFEECPDWTNIRSVFNCSLGFYSGNNSVELADYLREKNIMIEKPDWFATGKAVKDEK